MDFQNITDVEDALNRPGTEVTARELTKIWNQRVPVRTITKNDGAAGGTLSVIDWLQNDLENVTAFTAKALANQEYLLVCDAFDEAKIYWSQDVRKGMAGWNKQMALLTRHYAEARMHLGFPQKAREVLEPWANNPHLGAKERAKIFLQVGDIMREKSHHESDATSRRVTGGVALDFYLKALALDAKLLEALVLKAAMLLITGGTDVNKVRSARAAAQDALKVIDELEDDLGKDFRSTWYRAVALSILGRDDEAMEYYRDLKNTSDSKFASLAEARFRSQFIAEALGHSRDFYYEAFPKLQLLVFAGHNTDRPGDPVRFPLSMVDEVRAALREKLKELGAVMVVASAAAGADLLCIDEVLNLGGQCHIVLPWSANEFYRTSVEPYEPAGSVFWKPLFDNALNRAATVRELGQVYEPSDDVGWEFAQEVTAGITLLTARLHRLDVQPVVLWDEQAGRGAGGTQSFFNLWTQQLDQKPIVIKMPGSRTTSIMDSRHRRTEQPSTHQEVKSMLFADIVGYSKLTEKVMADFVNVFMQRLSVLLSNSPNAPRSVNTWGDAIYAAFDYSLDAGLFALQLAKMVHDGADDWKAKGLFHTAIDPETGKMVSYPLSVRVGLHTGPVLAHYNPILREIGYTGSHVNRAARIEPIAKPGEVYVSEEFAAMSELGKEMARRSGKQVTDAFVCEYAGSKALAKGYPGLFRIYRLIPEKNFAIEELAKETHRLYLETQGKEGKVMGSAPSLRPWEELAEDYKDANRAQVTDIPNKLFALGYELAPATGVSADEISPTDEEMEILARREHDRWMNERVRQGWTYAPVRDNARRHHPCIVPWEALSEPEKQKDRDTVLNMPTLIKKAGFQIRRRL